MDECSANPTSSTLGCMGEEPMTSKRSEAALELARSELASGERIGRARTVIHLTVLEGFGVSRRTGKGFAACEQMSGHRVACDAITYDTMLDACAECELCIASRRRSRTGKIRA